MNNMNVKMFNFNRNELKNIKYSFIFYYYIVIN